VKKNSGQSVPASFYTLIELGHLPAIKLTATIKQKYHGKWNQQYTTRIADKFTMQLYSPKSRTYMHIVLVYNLLQLFSSRGSFSIVLIYNLIQPIFAHGSFYIVLIYNLVQLISPHGSLSIIVYSYRMCYHYYCRGT
jgi:hypothetical protein